MSEDDKKEDGAARNDSDARIVNVFTRGIEEEKLALKAAYSKAQEAAENAKYSNGVGSATGKMIGSIPFGANPEEYDSRRQHMQMAAFTSALELPHSYGHVTHVRKNPVNDHLEVQTTSGISISVPPGAQAVQAANYAAMDHNRRNNPYDEPNPFAQPNRKVPLFDSDRIAEDIAATSPAVNRALSDFEYFMLKKKASEGTGLSPMELVSLCMEDIRRYETEESTQFQGRPHSMLIDLVSIDSNGKSHLTCYGCNLDNAQEIAYRTIFLDNAKDRWRGKV